MSEVANPRAIVSTLTDGILAELHSAVGSLGTAKPLPKRDRRNNRCPHNFVNQGKDICWECDPTVRHQTKSQQVASLRRVGL